MRTATVRYVQFVSKLVVGYPCVQKRKPSSIYIKNNLKTNEKLVKTNSQTEILSNKHLKQQETINYTSLNEKKKKPHTILKSSHVCFFHFSLLES